jgi:hypothetical protein
MTDAAALLRRLEALTSARMGVEDRQIDIAAITLPRWCRIGYWKS